MANTNTVLAGVAGLALGAGITYMVLDKKAQAAPKNGRKGTAPAIPPQPEPPGPGPGTGPGSPTPPYPGYRPPMSDTSVDLPMTVDERKALDKQVCNAIAAFEEAPEPADVALTTLQLLAPHVEWPAVPGDNQTIVALQSMVVFRVDQISTADPNLTAQENMAKACKPGLSLHPVPQEEPGIQPGWDPPQGG